MQPIDCLICAFLLAIGGPWGVPCPPIVGIGLAWLYLRDVKAKRAKK